MIRSGAVVLAASFAFSACAGHGMIPSSSGAMGDSSSMLRPAATTSPCLGSTLPYKFGGAFALAKLSSKASTTKLAAYKKFTVETAFKAGAVIGSGTVLFCDATGKGDITGKFKGKSFPLYSGAAGSGALYVEGVNTGKTSIGLNVTPTITIGGLKNGDTCSFVYINSKGKWTATPLSGKVSGGKVTFPSAPNEVGFAFPPATPIFLSAACK